MSQLKANYKSLVPFTFSIFIRTPLELHVQYDPSLLAFQPAVPGPPSTPINLKKLSHEQFHNSELEAQISEVLTTDHMKLWEDGIRQHCLVPAS